MFRNTIMLLKLLPLFVVLQVSRCSVVVDSFSQKGIYLSDYCPNMEFCPEGAHVMCMFYDPNHEMSPRCSNPQNVSMTPALANQLLDITNAIRSKIANGRETGYNGTRLPRGFGIFRLKWDNELATFAQVLVNQCRIQRDLCRATKRFPDPSQVVGLTRFSYPDWYPITRVISKPTPGLDDSKLTFAITQALKSWYMKKLHVTEDMIMRHPAFNSKLQYNLYLNMIHGSATHMGCGMSAFSQFVLVHAKQSKIYNSILVICNFSSQSKPGELTYSVLPSLGSSTCGCPEGSQEDSDCLCNEVTVQPQNRGSSDTIIEAETESCPNPDTNCEPTLVLLPIFTVEDAPPEKLLDRVEDIREPLSGYIADRLDNRSNIFQGSSNLEFNDIFGDTVQQRSFQPRSMQKPSPRQPYPAIPHSLSPVYPINTALMASQNNHISYIPSSKPIARQGSASRKAYAYPRLEQGQRRFSQSSIPAGHIAMSKKSSIFNRVANFKLPTDSNKVGQYDSIKPDVKPRKDFKNIDRVVNNYIQQRNNKFRRTEVVTSKHQDNLKKVTLGTTLKIEQNTEAILNNVEEKIINFRFGQKNNVTVDDNTKHFDLNYEESDNKLMTLLDTLEREVKHIELDGNEKEIIDAKIRKIYDTVARKPTSSFEPKLNSKSISKSKMKPLQMLSDLYENDFGESKRFLKHESNHITDDDHRLRHELDHLSEENRNGYKQDIEKIVNRVRDYDYLDNKFADKVDKSHLIYKEDKPGDVYDNKSFNDNDMLTDNDHKLFADIENKYNERLANLASRKYNDGVDTLGGKYDVIGSHKYSNTPSSRNRFNTGQYENLKPRATSNEVRSHRVFEKYDDKESMAKDSNHNDFSRRYLRNGEDDRKHALGDRNDAKGNPWGHEFERDPLSAERRKYYQEKLENLERRLHDRSFRRKNYEDRPNERVYRRLRPNVQQSERQKSKTQGDAFYMPDRARFLHGF